MPAPAPWAKTKYATGSTGLTSRADTERWESTVRRKLSMTRRSLVPPIRCDQLINWARIVAQESSATCFRDLLGKSTFLASLHVRYGAHFGLNSDIARGPLYSWTMSEQPPGETAIIGLNKDRVVRRRGK